MVLANEERFVITAEPVERLVDTTGAGDLFAAGFLYGFTNGYGPGDAARIGSICAAEIISRVGARCPQPLAGLLRARGIG